MQRVFTEDLVVNGRPKFLAGTAKDYPRNTWSGIAVSIGRPLGDFTISSEEAARRSVQSIPNPSTKSGGQSNRSGQRAKLKG